MRGCFRVFTERYMEALGFCTKAEIQQKQNSCKSRLNKFLIDSLLFLLTVQYVKNKLTFLFG